MNKARMELIDLLLLKSINDIAKMIGTTADVVKQYISNPMDMTISEVVNLCEGLNIQINKLNFLQ
ncbi:hypothetical protein D3C75_1108890 [compost metagenome]